MRAKLTAALLIVYLVWGSTYLAIAVADRSLPPLLMLSFRFALAGALLYGWSWWRGDVAAARPGRREWTAAAVVGGLLLFVDTGGVAWAEQRVASGLTALLVASVPLFAALLDRTFFGIRLSLGAIGGIAVGLLGVALLVGPSTHVDPVGAAVILVAAFAWACGSAYGRVAPLPSAPFLSAGMQMLCAGAFLAIAGAASGEVARVHPEAISAGSALALAFLVVFGSIVAFTAYGWLLRSGAPSVLVSTYAYVNPAVAVLLGWAFAGERVDGRMLAAGAVILASVGMLVVGRRPRRPVAVDAASGREQAVSVTRKRRWLVLFAVAVAVAGTARLALASGSQSAFVKVSFPRYGVSLRHPAAWATEKWCWSGAQETPIALLTTAQRAPRCTQPQVGVAASFPPAQQLGADGVTVGVSQLGLFPGTKEKWNTRIGGQPASIDRPVYGNTYDTPVACPKGVSRAYRSAGILRPHATNTALKVDAVICGPDLAAGEAAVHRVLESIRFARPKAP